MVEVVVVAVVAAVAAPRHRVVFMTAHQRPGMRLCVKRSCSLPSEAVAVEPHPLVPGQGRLHLQLWRPPTQKPLLKRRLGLPENGRSDDMTGVVPVGSHHHREFVLAPLALRTHGEKCRPVVCRLIRT